MTDTNLREACDCGCHRYGCISCGLCAPDERSRKLHDALTAEPEERSPPVGLCYNVPLWLQGVSQDGRVYLNEELPARSRVIIERPIPAKSKAEELAALADTFLVAYASEDTDYTLRRYLKDVQDEFRRLAKEGKP